jgi:nitrogenase subunit NifH
MHNPNLIYIADGCVPAIIGDDNIGVILSVKDKFKKAKIEKSSIIFDGFDGVTCVESEGSQPGIRYAGKGVIESLSTISAFRFYNT